MQRALRALNLGKEVEGVPQLEGVRVKLEGIKSKPEMNELFGVLVEYKADK